MWEQIKTSRNGIILSIAYLDFAKIEVEKKVNSNGIAVYEVAFHIDEVTDQSIVAYKIEDVSKVLEKAKGFIEDLYEDIAEYSDQDVYDWLDDFVDAINDF